MQEGIKLTYNIEYRENVLFIRLIGKLTKNNIHTLNEELDNIINNLGIYNIVFNFEELEEIDKESTLCLINWYNHIKSRKGVSLVCGVHGCIKRSNLLNYMKEIGNEISAIRVINWNN